jgi:hypothetical protein
MGILNNNSGQRLVMQRSDIRDKERVARASSVWYRTRHSAVRRPEIGVVRVRVPLRGCILRPHPLLSRTPKTNSDNEVVQPCAAGSCCLAATSFPEN